MKRYWKEFLLRGMMFGGFGPVILAVVYYIVNKTGAQTVFSGDEVIRGILSVYLLAFVHAGASVFNQIEEWGISKSIGAHFSVLYLAYSVCYLVNSWIPFDIKVFGFFTLIFITVYFVVWAIVYICVKRSSKLINSKLNK